MKHLLIAIPVLFIAACNTENTPAPSGSELASGTRDTRPVAAAATDSVQVSMEGENHVLTDIDWSKSRAGLEGGKLNVYLEQAENPLTITFSLEDPGLAGQTSAVYELPAANQDGVALALNFFDSSRHGLAMQQRIVFSSGTVELLHVSDGRLQMQFNGIGHPVVSKETFPVTGSIDISY